jgi:hypothetical protein
MYKQIKEEKSNNMWMALFNVLKPFLVPVITSVATEVATDATAVLIARIDALEKKFL